MIDFSKKIKKAVVEKSDNPVDIYNGLDRTSVAGPLRASQEMVLSKWYSERIDDKDVIIKLHTGEGKTLIGLLTLMTNLNRGNSPCIYVCPNKYLVEQVCKEASKFGIPVCTIGENNQLPNDFVSGNRILVTHVQKMFNGKTIFGTGNASEKVGAIVLDDAHACLDAIRESFVISVKRNSNKELYESLLAIFEDDLKEQGEGTFWDVKNNADYESLMMIPYWAWIDKKSQVLKTLAMNESNSCVTYVWPLIKDSLDKCQAFVNGSEIQIMPVVSPISFFGSFANAKHRILMSATTQDDSFFVKTLGISINAIKTPIVNEKMKWSGEKMLLIPELIADNLTRDAFIETFGKIEYKFGVVSLTPTLKKQDSYREFGCTLIDKNNIVLEINNLQHGVYGKMKVLANRYDGIDLPDNACRILVLDSLPFFTNMNDKYEEKARRECELIQKKLAQKIEQGLGRSVRGEKDYSCIVIIGSELVSFVRSITTRKLFSKQTQKQIEIGLQMAEWANEGREEISFADLISLINQCLKRDPGWKEFYESEMNSIDDEEENRDEELGILSLEQKADNFFICERYDDAAKVYQDILDKTKHDDSERGWYLQKMAHCKYFGSKLESQKLQRGAFEKNFELLKPIEGVYYKKIENINLNRTQNIIKYIQQFPSYEELMLEINTLCERLSFGTEADVFEKNLEEIGQALGYLSQRPDKTIRKGPDNLWGIGNNTFIMFECKSEVSQGRKEIHKSEVGQMNNHCGWFEKEYLDAKVCIVMIIPTSYLAYDADFTHDVKIMRKNEMQLLRKNFLAFFKEFKGYDIMCLEDKFIHDCLEMHSLDNESIMTKYAEDVKIKEQ